MNKKVSRELLWYFNELDKALLGFGVSWLKDRVWEPGEESLWRKRFAKILRKIRLLEQKVKE